MDGSYDAATRKTAEIVKIRSTVLWKGFTMAKKFFGRKAACLGLTATLIAGFTVTFIAPTAATICRELNLAGISLSLDKFTSENIDKYIRRMKK